MDASGSRGELAERVRDRIAAAVPLEQTLSIIVEMLEYALPEARVSVMRYHAATETLCTTSHSPFSPQGLADLNGLAVSPEMGSCGRAAATREFVVTFDIERDPLWEGHRHIARNAGLRACWSFPLVSANDVLFGTLAVYYATPRGPTVEEQYEIRRAADLLILSFARQRELDEQRVTEQRYQSLFFSHPDGVFELDMGGCFRNCNAAFERISGFRSARVIACHISSFVMPTHVAAIESARESAIRGTPDHCKVRIFHADGNLVTLHITMLPILVDGSVVGVYGVCRDITDANRRDEERRLLERGIEASVDGIAIADARDDEMPLVYVNRAFTRLTGYAREEALGRNCNFLQGPDTDPAARAEIRDALATRRNLQQTLLNYRKDGQAFWNQLSLAAVFDDNSECTHFVGIQKDVTSQLEKEALLAYRSTHDALTDLMTHETLLQKIVSMTQVVILHINLDGFCQVNNYVGYAVGNELLKAVGQRLIEALGPDTYIARLYGDCFEAALPDALPDMACGRKIDAVLSALSMPFNGIGGQTLQLSASIGAASTEHVGRDYDALSRKAESAARDAKRLGRNTWQWFVAADHPQEDDYVVLRRELQEAIANEQLELHYQPIVAAQSGELKSLEALVRWRHPTRGLISPGTFIPLAEATGQIIEIGTWVLWRACKDLAAQRRNRGLDVRVAVNVSPLQFRRPGFLDVVREALTAHGLEGDALEVEVTEGVLISGAERTIGVINELRAVGVHVAIDDFGTGYSSLSYLRDLPITKVKLDIGFVRDILSGRANAAIVEAVVSIAHHLGLEVVAEGVESPAQRDALIRYGCGQLQGFLFSKPQPLDVIAGGPRYLEPSTSS